MTPTAVMETPLKESEQKALSVPDQAKTFIVANNDQYVKGEEFLATCKALEDEIHKAWDETVELAYAAHKSAVASRKRYLDPLEEGRRILKGKMITYQTEQEHIRQEEQRKAEEEARKRAEEEALAAALQAEQSGDTATADAILAEPVQPPPVIVPKTAPAPSRLSAGRTVWYASVADVKKLCAAIGAGTASTEFVMGLDKDKKTGIISSPALNKQAASLKETMNVPGVIAKSKTV